MQNKDDELSGMDSFRIIDSMINAARNQMTESGHLYLLWGWVILTCSVGQFLMKHILHLTNSGSIWILTWAAVIYQIIYIKRKTKKARVKNYTDDILKYIWLVFIIMMILMAFVLSKIMKQQEQLNMVILVLYGMPTFLSGILLKFKPLIIGGVCCWCLSVISTFLPIDYSMLLVGVAVIAAWIIPGYLLQLKYKKINISI